MPFIRKAHTRRLASGRIVRVKAAHTNKPYTGKKIDLRQGRLQKYGYSANLNNFARHQALNRAVANYGHLKVYRMLGALYALQIRRAPPLANKYKANRNYVGTK